MTSAFRRPSALLPIVVLALGVCVPAQGKDAKKAPKPEPYSVVKVDAEIKVIKKSALKTLRSGIDRDYKQALKSHSQAAKDARKAKQKFNRPRPKKAKLKVLMATCKSEAEANKFVEKLREKDRKKRESAEKSGRKKSKAP